MAKAERAQQILHPPPAVGLRSALYYPHTEMKRANLVKSSLLLWDQVEFIVPFDGYRPHYRSGGFSEAIDLIGVMHRPSDVERRAAHREIEHLVVSGVPDSFFLDSRDPRDRYEIYPQKLLPDTWRLLREARLAGPPMANTDYPLAQHAGLGVMAILADCCAGETKRRITDRGAAYASLVGTLAGRPVDELHQQDAEAEERLVGLTLRVLDASGIPLKKLLAFRKRELKENGTTLRAARHNYVDKIETHVKRLTGLSRARDRNELDRVFEQDVRDDLAAFREGLQIGAKEAVFSREMFTAVVGAGTFAATMFGATIPVPDAVSNLGAPVTIGGLLGVKNNYLKARRDLIAKHPMAYLYEAKGGLRL